MTFVLSLLLKATILLLAGFGAARGLASATAALRHRLWGLLLIGLLLLPIGMLTLPQLRLPWGGGVAAAVPSNPMAPRRTRDAVVEAAVARRAVPATGTAQKPDWSWGQFAMLLWALGSAGLFSQLGLAVVRSGRMVQRSELVSGVPEDEFRRAGIAMGTGGGVRLGVLAEIAVPLVCGVWRPTVLLPPVALGWSGERLQIVFRHELAHVRRRDCAWGLLAGVAESIYWFHPLVRMAGRRMRIASELACDDAALDSAGLARPAFARVAPDGRLEAGLRLPAGDARSARGISKLPPTDGGIDARVYAGHLVEIARGVIAASPASPVALGFVGQSQLRLRVAALLDEKRARRPGGIALLVVAMLAGASAGVVAAAAPAQPQQAALAFDATSVEIVASGRPDNIHETGDARNFFYTGTLHQLLVQAYGVAKSQVGGEPGWFSSRVFSIQAESAVPANNTQMMAMVRTLLHDRFGLVVKQEQRELPVYLLEVDTGGPKFHALAANERPSKPPVPPGHFARSFPSIDILVANLNAQFGGRLRTDRLVLDRTGLTGHYDMVLDTVIEPPAGGAGGYVFPDLFRDLREQLGLKLVTAKAPVPYFMVVSASLPTPN